MIKTSTGIFLKIFFFILIIILLYFTINFVTKLYSLHNLKTSYNNTEIEAINLVKTTFLEVKNITKSKDSFGSTSNIQTQIKDNQWRLIFWQGSGDCPSGCINNRFWYFKVDSVGNVEKIGEYKRIFNPKINGYKESGIEIDNFLD